MVKPNPPIPKTSLKPLFKSVSEMICAPLPIDWLVHKFLESRSINMFFGAPSSGKSFITVDLALSIATGIPWHGHKVKKGRVIYIAGEGNRGYGARCAAWSIFNNISLDDVPLSFSNRAVNLSDPLTIEQLNAEIVEMVNQTGDSPCLIIFDTVARTMDGDENSTSEMAKFVQQLDNLKERYNCAILLVHHTGHGDQTRARGSSVLKAALDAEFCVSKEQSGMIRLTCTKMKEAEEPEPMAFYLTDVQLNYLDEDGNPAQKAAVHNICYTQPAKSSSCGLGRNQKLGLSLLNRMIDEQVENSQVHRTDAMVKFDDWQSILENEGIDKKRIREVSKSLVSARLIAINDDGYVRLCS